MIFNGFQKMTLLDFPGKVAITVFTGGCNFRCPFCHNALLVTKTNELQEYKEEEILDFLKKRKGLLDGVAITGGEPLLQKDIEGFMEKAKDLGFEVKLDTNGSYPERLKEIVAHGLVDYVAVDIKNSKEKYASTVGLKNFDIGKIDETISFLMQKTVPFEFRTTVVDELHEVEDIVKISEWIKGDEPYYLQNFVDSGDLITPGLHAASKEKMLEMREKAASAVPNTYLRGL